MTRSALDQLICEFDRALKISTGSLKIALRPSPAQRIPDKPLTKKEQLKSARLMRVNHTGEVCAQALYQGQALTARNSAVTGIMQHAAEEECDHLVWCETRLQELNTHTSFLNPFFYLGSMAMGAFVGALGDRTNLGFLAATEDGVVQHLTNHLTELPKDDDKSRAIVTTMREDESRHAHHAIEYGGRPFPVLARRIMDGMSRLMTKTTYWF